MENRKEVMKKILISLAFTILLVPAVVLGATFQSNNTTNIEKSEVIKDDLYISSAETNIKGTIEGDLYIMAGQVNVDGEVAGDLNILGGTVSVNGKVGDDLRAAGGTVEIGGKVDDDLFIATGQCQLKPSSVIDGEVYIGAGSLVIAGQTESIKAGIGNLTVKRSGTIKGDLIYQSQNQAEIAPEADINGEVNFKQTQQEKKTATTFRLVYGFLSSVLVGVLLIYLLSSFIEDTLKDCLPKVGLSILWGMGILIITPILAIILLMTIIGTPLSIGLMLVYPILLYLGKIIGMIGLGFWLIGKFKSETELDWLAVILGAFIFYLLGLVAIVGPALQFTIQIIGLGLFISQGIKEVKRLKV